MDSRIETRGGEFSAAIGKPAVNVVRMVYLLHGLRMEIQGMRLTRGPTCYSIIKREYGLKGRRGRVLEQFGALVQEAKAAVPYKEVGE